MLSWPEGGNPETLFGTEISSECSFERVRFYFPRSIGNPAVAYRIK